MIDRFREKIKAWSDEVFVGLAAALVVVIIVGSWRLWEEYRGREEPRLVEHAFSINLDAPGTSRKAFVASKNGSVYYAVTCKAASRIKEPNRLFFASALEAEGAGFRRSAQCGN